MSNTETNHALSNASAWMDSIKSMTLAMDPDNWDRLEGLKQEREECKDTEYPIGCDDLAELEVLESALKDFEDAEDARTQAQESALDVELSGTWHPGETPEPDSFVILLTTGGPALRITGSLGRYNTPENPVLEYQDWGTGWTRYYGENLDSEALETFCGCFYFGE